MMKRAMNLRSRRDKSSIAADQILIPAPNAFHEIRRSEPELRPSIRNTTANRQKFHRHLWFSVSQNPGEAKTLFFRAVDRDVVTGIGVAHHAGRRVVPQNPLDATGSIIATIAANDHA